MNDRAGGGEGAAGELCGGATAKEVEGLTTLRGEVKGGGVAGSAEAPYGEDGIDDRGGEVNRFGESRSSLELNGRRMRRRVTDDAASEGRGGGPAGNVGEAGGLAGVADVDAADGAGGAGPGDSVGMCDGGYRDRAGGKKKRGHWIYKQAFQLHSHSPLMSNEGPGRFFIGLGMREVN